MVSVEEGEGTVTAKIIDLGLAKPASDAPPEAAISTPGAFAGTPEFASPEQFAGALVRACRKHPLPLRALELRPKSELRLTRDRFPQLHPMLASDITARTLDQILKKLSDGARNPVMRYLRAVFNFGLKRNYLSENPINRLDFAHRPRREVEIIPNSQVSKMLHHALSHDLPLLPYLVLGFFCGIRPDGEIQEMIWSDIDLTDRIVVIRPEVSKTRRRRFPDLSENAKGWLVAYHDLGGSGTGKIVTYNESELRYHRTKNWQAAGIKKWIPSGMRHT
jgi:integrase